MQEIIQTDLNSPANQIQNQGNENNVYSHLSNHYFPILQRLSGGVCRRGLCGDIGAQG